MLSKKLLSTPVSTGATEWTVVDSVAYRQDTSGGTMTLNGLQNDDLILLQAGADATVLTGTTVSGIPHYDRGDFASISYWLGSTVHSGGSSSASYSFSGNQPDYGILVAFRSPSPTAGYTRVRKDTSADGASPFRQVTHENTSVSMSAGTLAVLTAYIDDQADSAMTAPADSTLVKIDYRSSRGTIGMAYKHIDTAGNYSWGVWGTDIEDTWITTVDEYS